MVNEPEQEQQRKASRGGLGTWRRREVRAAWGRETDGDWRPPDLGVGFVGLGRIRKGEMLRMPLGFSGSSTWRGRGRFTKTRAREEGQNRVGGQATCAVKVSGVQSGSRHTARDGSAAEGMQSAAT